MIDAMVDRWTEDLHTQRYHTSKVALPCDYCMKILDSEDSRWIECSLDKSIWFCCEECQESWLKRLEE